ncbi:predicted protein [Sclerotinia sclerotiorum 1980 UF-70]|uniref:Uncharacterized protein n=1 Tax=Sclerotinia sclerotiorum (strain ATCC 18683 / 1980 / Ss-1) TaxID=665079 RepID=A7EGN9_SCLS1|nr:predicted protein [Sclerotinia sclerotiorum 1980 UF-70]EDO02005.1 predicted protein [Sclerotinia sclerotiorum 1980 UF-70]
MDVLDQYYRKVFEESGWKIMVRVVRIGMSIDSEIMGFEREWIVIVVLLGEKEGDFMVEEEEDEGQN